MTEYEPELGQAAFGAPWGPHDLPRFVDALLQEILHVLDRVYWNVNQRSFEDAQWDAEFDVGIPGVTYRPYRPLTREEEKLDVPPDRPNFRFEDVSIYWYKHPRRGLSCSRELDKLSWIDWFDRCVAVLEKFDAAHYEKMGLGSLVKGT